MRLSLKPFLLISNFLLYPYCYRAQKHHSIYHVTMYKLRNFIFFNDWSRTLSTIWSSGNAFVSGAGGPMFKSRAGQIGHSVANGSPSSATFLRKNLCCAGSMTRKRAPPTCYTSWRNTASMKDLNWNRTISARRCAKTKRRKRSISIIKIWS